MAAGVRASRNAGRRVCWSCGGVEQGGIAPPSSGPGRRQPPPTLHLRVRQRLPMAPLRREPASRGRGAVVAGRPRRPPTPPAGVGNAAGPAWSPPRAWPAATPARRLGAPPPRWPRRPPPSRPTTGRAPAARLLGEGRGGLLWGAAIRRGGLLGPWTRMPHEPTHLRLRAPPRAGRHRHGPEDAVPMPLATRFVRAPPRLLSSEGQGRVRLAPRFPVLAYRPGRGTKVPKPIPCARARPHVRRLSALLSSTRRGRPPGPGRGTPRSRPGFPHCTRLPIPPTAPPRPAALTAHAQPQASLCAIATPVFPRPIGRAGAPGGWGAASYLP